MKKISLVVLITALCGCTTVQEENRVRYSETIERINELISPGMDIYEAQKTLKAKGIRAGDVVSLTGQGDDLVIYVRFGYRPSRLDTISQGMQKNLPGTSDVPIRIVIFSGSDNKVSKIGSGSANRN